MEISTYRYDSSNKIYSDKLFYTNVECIKQRVDTSDNYFNSIDKILRTDVNKSMRNIITTYALIKKYLLVDDIRLRNLIFFINTFMPYIVK